MSQYDTVENDLFAFVFIWTHLSLELHDLVVNFVGTNYCHDGMPISRTKNNISESTVLMIINFIHKV